MPKTDFPMRGGLPNKEPQIQEMWDNDEQYRKALEKNKNNPSFILHDGPPYANGNLHMGHALNKIIKDIQIRFNDYHQIGIKVYDTIGSVTNYLLKNAII